MPCGVGVVRRLLPAGVLVGVGGLWLILQLSMDASGLEAFAAVACARRLHDALHVARQLHALANSMMMMIMGAL